jgi:alcohol dehydrogenase class IV
MSTRAEGDFLWRDAGRTVLFRSGGLAQAPELLAANGFDSFELLSTPRALRDAAKLAAAETVHEVSAGGVPELAAEILPACAGPRLVAFGGGRVIDVAKAVAAVTGAAVAAIPTTLSGAEMTGIHRLPAGSEQQAKGLVRPELVIADLEAMTAQPEGELRASAMNALAHGADSLYTPFANPVSRMCALEGARLIAEALDQPPAERDRAALARGSLLCGYAIDSGLFAIHHVICQTLVRVLGVPHAQTNAAILPRAMEAMAERAPEQIADFARSVGAPVDGLAQRILELADNPAGLGELGAQRSDLEAALDGIEARPELQFAPDPPDHEELRRIIEAAW